MCRWVWVDGCEVRPCDPCARVRPCVPCVSRVCPGSPRCLFTGTNTDTSTYGDAKVQWLLSRGEWGKWEKSRGALMALATRLRFRQTSDGGWWAREKRKELLLTAPRSAAGVRDGAGPGRETAVRERGRSHESERSRIIISTNNELIWVEDICMPSGGGPSGVSEWVRVRFHI